jgi:hypothetical protein
MSYQLAHPMHPFISARARGENRDLLKSIAFLRVIARQAARERKSGVNWDKVIGLATMVLVSAGGWTLIGLVIRHWLG